MISVSLNSPTKLHEEFKGQNYRIVKKYQSLLKDIFDFFNTSSITVKSGLEMLILFIKKSLIRNVSDQAHTWFY